MDPLSVGMRTRQRWLLVVLQWDMSPETYVGYGRYYFLLKVMKCIIYVGSGKRGVGKSYDC